MNHDVLRRAKLNKEVSTNLTLTLTLSFVLPNLAIEQASWKRRVY
jgi:hypothetical protein